MPYTVCINRPGFLPEQDPQAVATIEEACAYVEGELDAPLYDQFDKVSDIERVHAHVLNELQATVRHALGETGGVIGPLPDGYVIDVWPVSYAELLNLVIDGAGGVPDDVSGAILDAYNSQD